MADTSFSPHTYFELGSPLDAVSYPYRTDGLVGVDGTAFPAFSDRVLLSSGVVRWIEDVDCGASESDKRRAGALDDPQQPVLTPSTFRWSRGVTVDARISTGKHRPVLSRFRIPGPSGSNGSPLQLCVASLVDNGCSRAGWQATVAALQSVFPDIAFLLLPNGAVENHVRDEVLHNTFPGHWCSGRLHTHDPSAPDHPCAVVVWIRASLAQRMEVFDYDAEDYVLADKFLVCPASEVRRDGNMASSIRLPVARASASAVCLAFDERELCVVCCDLRGCGGAAERAACVRALDPLAEERAGVVVGGALATQLTRDKLVASLCSSAVWESLSTRSLQPGRSAADAFTVIGDRYAFAFQDALTHPRAAALLRAFDEEVAAWNAERAADTAHARAPAAAPPQGYTFTITTPPAPRAPLVYSTPSSDDYDYDGAGGGSASDGDETLSVPDAPLADAASTTSSTDELNTLLDAFTTAAAHSFDAACVLLERVCSSVAAASGAGASSSASLAAAAALDALAAAQRSVATLAGSLDHIALDISCAEANRITGMMRSDDAQDAQRALAELGARLYHAKRRERLREDLEDFEEAERSVLLDRA